MAVTSVKKDATDNFWWTKFLTHGFQLLTKEAQLEFSKKYMDFLNLSKRFPLCASAIHDEKLAPSDIQKLKDMFTSAEPAYKNKAMSPIPALLDSNFMQWSQAMKKLVDAFSGPPMPWSLIILSGENQKKMCAQLMPNTPSAVPYFRYLTVCSKDAPKPAIISTFGSAKDTVVFQGKVTTPALELRFSEFSRGDAAGYTVKFDGGWAPLQLLFEPNVLYDEKSATAYIPILLKDEQGLEYVYCIGVQYSKELLPPQQWPKASDIPKHF